MMNHIRHCYSSNDNKEYKSHKLASIKFWHAWSNGVTIEWMVNQLIHCGCVTHFVLIGRNPVRITVSEQYANRYRTWQYQKSRQRSAPGAVCDRSYLAYHIGGRWVAEMARTHYMGFTAVQSAIERVRSQLQLSFPAHIGLSYEADMLPDPVKAYEKIMGFLQLESQAVPPPRHRKGMICPLRDMLVNFEELVCSLQQWEMSAGVARNSAASVMWMASDTDVPITFDSMLISWRKLLDDLGEHGALSECTLDDIGRSGVKVPLSVTTKGVCGTGGETNKCRGIPAVPPDGPDLCFLSMHRAGCDAMTFKDGHCYLHKNISTFSLTTCATDALYRSKF